MDFSVIPFQTRFTRIQQVVEPGTGRPVDQEIEEWHTHQAYLGEGPGYGSKFEKSELDKEVPALQGL